MQLSQRCVFFVGGNVCCVSRALIRCNCVTVVVVDDVVVVVVAHAFVAGHWSLTYCSSTEI